MGIFDLRAGTSRVSG